MRRKTSTWVVALLLIVTDWMANPRVSESFNDEAHKILSTRAVNPGLTNASTLDSFLKDVLGFEFPQGINEPLHGGQDGTVVGQIRVGSVNEDKGKRPRNHFHDPTKAWGTAGLSHGFVGQSSVVWSQNPTQSEGKHSWKDARDAYFNALTSTTSDLRKSWYAELFQNLGHLIHLVQDAAVPSHTRNDSHLVIPDTVPVFGGLKIDPDPFHYWADGPVGLNRINQSSSVRFDPSILNQGSPNPLAPVPVARIIDKTDGDLGILSPNVNIGLSEYSNANFISKGTGKLEASGYQYPNSTQLIIQNELGPNNLPRPYARFRPGFGEQDYRVGVSTRLTGFVNATVPPDKFPLLLDDKVHEDYGRKLFPRAIGYSAGLIDYFFAGNVNAVALAWPANATSIHLTSIMSFSYPGAPRQPSGTGSIVLVVVTSQVGTGNLTYYVSQPRTITVVPNDAIDPNPIAVEVDMDFLSNPLPDLVDSGIESLWTVLVWQGPVAELGQGQPIIVEQQGVFATQLGICCN